MKIKLFDEPYAYCLVVAKDGRSFFVQSDWDCPGIASAFGWIPCKCGHTDGTVNCEHRTATEMISEAIDYIQKHIGKSVEDPGYFSC